MTDTAIVKTEPLVPADVSHGALEAAIGLGDFSKLTPNDRLKYIAAICQTTGLNPLTKPFDYITLNGKLTLYANKGCAEQLRNIHGVSISIVERLFEHGCLVVHAKATDRNGRQDESVGVVGIPENARGDVMANAMMKAETKAKRRVTLSICGLGMIDESELGERTAKASEVMIDGATTVETKRDALMAEVEPMTVTVSKQELPEPKELIPDDLHTQICSLIRPENIVVARAYLRSEKAIGENETLSDLPEKWAKRILANPEGFMRKVKAFENSNKQD